MVSQIIYNDCSILAKEVINSSLEKVSESGGSLISFKNPKKVDFVPGKALKCTAHFEATGKLPSGTYEIEKDRKAVYWKTYTYTLQEDSSSDIEQRIENAKQSIIDEINKSQN
jgi:hypothetical protein